MGNRPCDITYPHRLQKCIGAGQWHYRDPPEQAGEPVEELILVNSTFTFSLLVGLSVGGTTLGTLVANLGFTDVVTPKPVFIGDTLRAQSEVAELRESKSRPEAGIVTFKHEMLNQRDEVVCRCLRSALLKKASA